MFEFIKLVEQSRKKSADIQQKFQIALVCNSRSRTRIINNQKVEFSDNNEFFSDFEYSEIFNGIQGAGFYVHPFFNELTFITKTLDEAYYQNNKIVYNLSRNGNHVGKKSLIPSFCDLLSIPYTGSNALITSYCRAKYMYTKYLEAHQIKTPESWIFYGEDHWLNHNKPVEGTKVLIKPMHESASIGLEGDSVITIDKKSLSHLESICNNGKGPVFMQKFIEGYECEVPLFIDNQIYALEPVGISINGNNELKSEILTFERSFKDQYEFYNLSDELEKSIVSKIKSSAIQVAQLMNITNYGRVDFRITNDGIAYLIDIATSPYTTKHSSFAHSFKNLQLSYADIYSTIINLAFKSK